MTTWPNDEQIDLTRRRVLAALAVGAASGTAAAAAPGRPRDAINVKDLGAFGDGKLPDLRQIREAIRRASERMSGATIYFPPGEYFLGSADDAILLAGDGLRDVHFVGDRATLTCRSVNGSSNMLQLSGCRNVTVEGLAFRDHGLKREINWLGAAAIRMVDYKGQGCEDIEIKNCTFDSVLAATVCRRSEKDIGLRTRNLKLTNLRVRGSYYGFSFQDNGDNVIGRGLVCEDVKRSYFPFGVSNHDIELDTSNNSTGFTDVLIKCYHADTSGIKVKVKCRRKRSGDAIVALDNQHEQGRGTIRQIDIMLDVDDIDCRLDTVVLIRSFSPEAKYERETRNRWDSISIDGDVRICERTQLLDIATVSATPGTLRIGPRLAKNPRLPKSFPGFHATVG